MLHAVNLIIIGSPIMFKYGGYQQNPVSQSYHPVLDIHITSQRLTWIGLSLRLKGFMAGTLSSPRHGACAYPTTQRL